MTTKKTAAKKTVAKKTTTKKSTPRPSGTVKVKMIQTVDSAPGRDTMVFFTDGTHAVIEAGNKLAKMLSEPESVAPNMIQVTLNKGNIVDAERVDTGGTGA